MVAFCGNVMSVGGALHRGLDLRPRRVGAIHLEDVRGVLPRLGVRLIRFRPIGRRRAVGRPDDDHDLRAIGRRARRSPSAKTIGRRLLRRGLWACPR